MFTRRSLPTGGGGGGAQGGRPVRHPPPAAALHHAAGRHGTARPAGRRPGPAGRNTRCGLHRVRAAVRKPDESPGRSMS